jgi:hypothetical protein
VTSLTRLEQFGWSQGRALAFSLTLRTSYHVYYGLSFFAAIPFGYFFTRSFQKAISQPADLRIFSLRHCHAHYRLARRPSRVGIASQRGREGPGLPCVAGVTAAALATLAAADTADVG